MDWLVHSHTALLQRFLYIQFPPLECQNASLSRENSHIPTFCHLTDIQTEIVLSFAFQVFLHPNSAPLWKEYLLFTQSYFSNFTVSKVNSAYGKCLSTLSAVRDGSMVSHPALPGIEEDMLGNRDFV